VVIASDMVIASRAVDFCLYPCPKGVDYDHGPYHDLSPYLCLGARNHDLEPVLEGPYLAGFPYLFPCRGPVPDHALFRDHDQEHEVERERPMRAALPLRGVPKGEVDWKLGTGGVGVPAQDEGAELELASYG